MAGEFMVINPRRRRRKAKANTRKRRRRARAHHNPTNRRRRRSTRARSHRRGRRVHSNPRGLNLAGIDFGAAAITAVAFIGSDVGAGFLTKMLPANWQGGPTRLAVKVGIGIAIPLVARRFIGARVSNLLVAGVAVSVLVDAYRMWVAPAMGLSDYELTGYEAAPMGTALGQDDYGNELSEIELGASENMYSDTMY
jgi:hypothetical protein